MKLILGFGETLTGRFLLYDGFKMRFREMNVACNAECEIYGDSPTITRFDPHSPFYKP